MRLLLIFAFALGLASCGSEGEPAASETAVEVAPAAVASPPLDAGVAVEAADPPQREINDGTPVEGQSNTVADAAPAAEAAPGSCEAEVGAAAAKALVEVCLNVSPATRPPCNAANSCELIQSEIQRGCNLLGDDAPEDCPRL